MATVYRLLQRSSLLRPYLPHAKKYDPISADDDVPPPPQATHDVECDVRQCRICLADQDPEGDLISPCLCSGSVRWVHRHCLDEWRAQEIRPNSFEQCELCQFRYETEVRERPTGRALRLRLLVARDLCAMFGAVQLVIILQASLLRALDVHGRLASKMPSRLSQAHPFLAFYCLSLLLVLALVGLVGMCVACTASDAPTMLCLYDPWLSASTGDCLFAGCEAGELGALCAGVLFVLLLVLAVVGIVCSVFFATFVFSHVVRRHVDLSQRRDEARHVVVVDLSTKGPRSQRPPLAVGRSGSASGGCDGLGGNRADGQERGASGCCSAADPLDAV